MVNRGAIWGIATQSITLGEETAEFYINETDAAQVHLRVGHADGSATVYTFAHNGGLLTTEEVEAPEPPGRPHETEAHA